MTFKFNPFTNKLDIVGSGGGGGGITTLDGDTGSATGSTILVTARGSISGQNCGSSVSFTGSGSTLEIDVTDANGNTLIGRGAGKLNTTGSSNVGLGVIALRSISTTLSPNNNTAIGFASMASTVQGVNNTAVGSDSLLSSIGDWNAAFGFQALQLLVGTAGVGDFNTALGPQAGYQLLSGVQNNLIGYNAGGNYISSESNNICIGHPGSPGEDDTTRIGLGKTACFVSGIAGVAISNPNLNMVTIDTSSEQMGSVAFSQGTWVPDVQFGGSSTGFVYSTQLGEYTQVGNIVFINGDVAFTTVGSGTGAVTITGLPVRCIQTNSGAVNLPITQMTISSVGSSTMCFNTGTASFALTGIVNNSATGANAAMTTTNTTIANGQFFRFSGFYFAG